MLNPINKTIELSDGRVITIETGKLAKQADGAVTVRMNNTMLLATVCAAKDANPGVDFMPLQVEYKEKFSAFGRFPGGFTKREGKASDYEILTARLVDRALRPLFPDNYHAEVYVNVILFSSDGEDMPDALAGLAASAALATRLSGRPDRSSCLSITNWKALVSFSIFCPKVSCNIEISAFSSRSCACFSSGKLAPPRAKSL